MNTPDGGKRDMTNRLKERRVWALSTGAFLVLIILGLGTGTLGSGLSRSLAFIGISFDADTDSDTDMTVSAGDTVTDKMTPALSPRDKLSLTLSPSLSPRVTAIMSVSPSVGIQPTNTPRVSISPVPTHSGVTPSPTVSVSVSVSVTPTLIPIAMAIVINEIGWMGTMSSATDEWIELYNNTGNAVNLNGWRIESKTGSNPDPHITLSGVVASFSYFLLERTNNSTISDIGASQIYVGALNNTCETLELRDNAGNLIDSVVCSGGWFAGDNTARASMERINSMESGSSATNWGTNNGIIITGHDSAGNSIKGTPGAKNSITP